MKTTIQALAAALVLAVVPARAQQVGGFGAGVVVGDPTGLTVKTWIDSSRALDAGVGFSGEATFYADYLWHAWDVFPQPSQGKLGAYVGGGPRIETRRDAEFGLRALAGVDYWIAGRPIEVFFEAGPVLRLTPGRGVGVDGGLGVRFYFGAGK
jgi:hypothetical protein